MADHNLFDTVRVRARCNLRPYLAGPVAIDLAIGRLYFGEQAGDPPHRLEGQCGASHHLVAKEAKGAGRWARVPGMGGGTAGARLVGAGSS